MKKPAYHLAKIFRHFPRKNGISSSTQHGVRVDLYDHDEMGYLKKIAHRVFSTEQEADLFAAGSALSIEHYF